MAFFALLAACLRRYDCNDRKERPVSVDALVTAYSNLSVSFCLISYLSYSFHFLRLGLYTLSRVKSTVQCAVTKSCRVVLSSFMILCFFTHYQSVFTPLCQSQVNYL